MAATAVTETQPKEHATAKGRHFSDGRNAISTAQSVRNERSPVNAYELLLQIMNTEVSWTFVDMPDVTVSDVDGRFLRLWDDLEVVAMAGVLSQADVVALFACSLKMTAEPPGEAVML